MQAVSLVQFYSHHVKLLSILLVETSVPHEIEGRLRACRSKKTDKIDSHPPASSSFSKDGLLHPDGCLVFSCKFSSFPRALHPVRRPR